MTESRDLRTVGPNELANLGLPNLVYIKPVTKDGRNLYAVHAANGQPIGLSDSFESAVAAAFERDLEPVSIH